jgi:hypothetical protein
MGNEIIETDENVESLTKEQQKTLDVFKPSEKILKAEERTLQSDFEFTRAMYRDLVLKGQQSLSEMQNVCDATEHPRAYEVLFKGIKDVADVADKLMDTNKKRLETRKVRDDLYNEDRRPSAGETSGTGSEGGNQVMFVGSTNDLLKALQDQEKDITNKAKVINDVDDK